MISCLQIVIRIAVFASPWFPCFIASSRGGNLRLSQPSTSSLPMVVAYKKGFFGQRISPGVSVGSRKTFSKSRESFESDFREAGTFYITTTFKNQVRKVSL